MRKYNFSLIKKTEVRYGLYKGASGFESDIPRDSERIMRFELHGKSAEAEDGTLTHVGDAASDGSYVIPFKLCGKNLMSAVDFANLHMAATTGSHTLTDTYYRFIARSSDDGAVIIDSSIIPFKEKTQYTIGGHFSYIVQITNQPLQLKINYTNGSSEPLRFPTSEKDFYGAFVTAKGKTVKSITSFMQHNGPNKIMLDCFGIFEGAYDDILSVYEPYVATEFNISLSAPLRSLGYSSDVLDLKSKTVTRRIYTAQFGADGDPEPWESDEIFMISLPYSMKQGCPIISNIPEYETQEELSSAELGIYRFDKDALLIKIMGAATKDDAISALSADPLIITYVLDKSIYEANDIEQPLTDGYTRIEVASSVMPKKFFMVYR